MLAVEGGLNIRHLWIAFVAFPLSYASLVVLGLTGGVVDTPVPSLATIGLQIVQCMLIMEVWFYSAHRLFHWGPLYRRFHKRHHEFTVRPFSVSPVFSPCVSFPPPVFPFLPITPSLLTAHSHTMKPSLPPPPPIAVLGERAHRGRVCPPGGGRAGEPGVDAWGAGAARGPPHRLLPLHDRQVGGEAGMGRRGGAPGVGPSRTGFRNDRRWVRGCIHTDRPGTIA